MPVVQCQVDSELHRAVKRYALDHGITMRVAVVRALAALVGAELPQAPETVSESPSGAPSESAEIGGSASVAPLQGVSFDD